MSLRPVVKFLVNLLGLILFLPFLIYEWLRDKFKKTRAKKPCHPVKIIPKYAKNKQYLPRNYVNPWTEIIKKKSNKWKRPKEKDLKTSKPRNLPAEKSV